MHCFWHFLIINRKERDDSVWSDMIGRYFEHNPQCPWDVRPGVLKPWTVVTDVRVYNQAASQAADTAADSEEHADAEYVEAEIVDEDPRKKEEKSGTTQNISIVNNGSGIAAWNIGELTVNMGDKK